MVDLPRYVKPQKKPNGRVFYYYERHRGTSRAWPRIPLFEEPSRQEFWARCRQCERLEASFDESAWTWAFRAESGRVYPLPDPKSAGFWTAVQGAEDRERKLAAAAGKTFSALIGEYRTHAAYKDLAGSTRTEYDRYLDSILAAWSDDPVRDLTSVDVQKALDAYQATSRAGEFFRAVLSRILNFGVPRGYSVSNVAEKTEKIRYEEQPYKPWPEWAFELFFTYARVGLHIPIYSAVFTGQRSVDVIPMMRPKSGAQQIELVARKTGEQVWVPIHFAYREVIDVICVEHVRLHLREDGEAWTVPGYRTAWQRELTFTAPDDAAAELRDKAAAMKRIRSEGLVFHGFRKNAVNMLLEVGCTEAQVSSIVEMSEAMVRHYAKDVNKRRLAVAGMKKLEGAWKTTNTTVFGTAASPLLKNAP